MPHLDGTRNWSVLYTKCPLSRRLIPLCSVLSWILIYVDDCLLSCPSVHERASILQELSKHFELKQMGCIENKTSQLEFLGRIIRHEFQDSSLLLGLPTSYYDDIESALGCQLSPQPNPPDITRFAVSKEEERLLGAQDASLYRTVLGKLAWYSLTFPTLSLYVSFLSSYQQTPTEQSFTAIKLVLRWTKFYRGCMLSLQTAS